MTTDHISDNVSLYMGTKNAMSFYENSIDELELVFMLLFLTKCEL